MALSESVSDQSVAPRIGRSVSIDHAAELLGVSRRTVYNRIRDGRLQTVRTLGGSQRVTLESVSDLGGRRPDASEERTARTILANVVVGLVLLMTSIRPAAA